MPPENAWTLLKGLFDHEYVKKEIRRVSSFQVLQTASRLISEPAGEKAVRGHESASIPRGQWQIVLQKEFSTQKL